MDETAKAAGGMSTTAKVSLAAMAVAAGATAKAVIQLGAEFKAQMSVVKAISGAGAKDMELLTAKAKQMGAETQFSSTEAGEALEYMAMAGWKTHDMLDGIEGIMYAAGASGESLAKTADIVTDGLTAFGLEAEQSGRFADVLAQASANSNTNIGMMGETFKYVAPIAGSLGYSIEDTALSIGLLANAGIKGGQAGTMLRSILSNMIAPSDDAAAAMDELGISLSNADGTMKPFEQSLREIRQSFQGLTEEQKAQYAATIGGQRGMTGLLTIVDAAEDDFNALARSIENSTGAAKQMNEVRLDNLQGDIEIFKSGLEDLGLTIYDNFDTPLRTTVQAGTKGIDDLNRAFQRPEIRNALKDIGEGFGNLISVISKMITAVIPPAITAFGGVVKVLGTLSPVIAGVAAGFATMKIVNEVNSLMTAARNVYEKAQIQLALYMQTQKLSTIATAADAAALGLKEVIVAVVTGKMTLATAAQWAWNTAMAANPIGLLIVGVGALIGGIVALVKWLNRTTEEEKALNVEIDKTKQSADRLSDSINDSADAHKRNLEEMEISAGAASNLADKVYELSAAENKSAEDKRKLQAYVDMLNESMEGLNLSYDAEHDQLSMTREALQGVIESRKESIKAQAEQQRAVEIAKEQIDVELQLEDIARRKAEAEELYGEGTRKYNKAVKELVESEETLNGQLVESEANFNAVTDSIVETEMASVNATGTMSQVFTTMFGEVFADQEDFLKKQEEIREDFTKQVAAVNDMFNQISSASDENTQNYIENLQNNIDESNKFYENLQTLTDIGLDAALVQQFREKGIESAAEVAVLAQSTETEVQELNRLIVEATEAGTQGLKETWENAGLEEAMTSPYAKALEESQKQISEFMALGEDIAEGVIQGLENKEDAVTEAGASISTAAEDGAREASQTNSPSKVFAEIGVDLGEGMALGIEQSTPTVVARIIEMLKQLLVETTTGATNVQNELRAKFSMTPDLVYKEIYPAIAKVTSWGADMKREASRSVDEFNNTIIKELAKLPKRISDELNKALDAVKAWFNDLKSTAEKEAPEFVKKTVDEISKIKEPMPEIGAAMVDGLWSGMQNRESWFNKQIKAFVRNAVGTMKDELDIRSPSGVTEEIGVFTVMGFINGIKSMASQLDATTRQIFGLDDIVTAGVGAITGKTMPALAGAGASGVQVHQHIQTVPQTPYELAQTSAAAYERTRWRE